MLLVPKQVTSNSKLIFENEIFTTNIIVFDKEMIQIYANSEPPATTVVVYHASEIIKLRKVDMIGNSTNAGIKKYQMIDN